MAKTSKRNSLDPDYLPILRYLKLYLQARKWKVTSYAFPRENLVIWASRRLRLRNINLSLRLQEVESKFYVTKMKLDSSLNLLSPSFLLEQYGKSLHAIEDGTTDLWMVENAVGCTKLLKLYNEMSEDLGHPIIF